ncbi:MAG: hypothetical protein RIC30_21140 [Marinoscillum sp.]|uniref:hypothetical protein n=1 Tax=Marinoscillum sp. TaxID=2024838 RepID=UPI0032FB87C8
MKNIQYIIVWILVLCVLGACDTEAIDEIGNPVFYVQVPTTAPETAFPNKVISFPIEVYAEAGLEKVELKVDFQTLDGSEITSFDDPKHYQYQFSYKPTNADLGSTQEFAVVAHDKRGFTYDVSYLVEVVLEPVNMEFTLPEILPDTLEVGDTLDFEVQIKSEDELDKIETLLYDNPIEGLTVSSFENSFAHTYHFQYVLVSEDGGKDVTFTFRATDDELKSDEISYTLFVIGERVPLAIDTHLDVVLGMQGNPEVGPFIDLSENVIYTVPEAKANSANVDMGTFRSGSSGINLFAPTYSNAAQFIYNTTNWGDDWLGNWTVRNSLEIRRVSAELMTSDDFYAIADDKLILETFDASEPSAENITKTEEGEILAIKTVNEEYALILVKTIVASSSGSITFDYKVQQ